MKSNPLPPMPRKSVSLKERQSENLKRLPAVRIEWGSLEVGGWAEKNVGGTRTVIGRCARCGDVADGKDLMLVRRPFGRGEEWWCRNCDTSRIETE